MNWTELKVAGRELEMPTTSVILKLSRLVTCLCHVTQLDHLSISHFVSIGPFENF